MASAEVRHLVRCGGTLIVLTVLALATPARVEAPRVVRGPLDAAGDIENEVPELELDWGPLRGWKRVGEGWEVIWQPPHGMWLVRGWAADEGGEIRWRLAAAPWLPGARLSGHAAALAAGSEGSWMVPRELTARRDWQLGDARLVGAIAGGVGLPGPAGFPRSPIWEAILAGLVLAGALARLLVPPFRVSPWRYRILGALFLALVGLPWSLPLSARYLEVGVRPWVAQSAFLMVAGVVAGGVALGSLRFSPSGGVPPAFLPLLAFPCGLLLGRLEFLPWVVEAAAVPGRLFLWLGMLVLVSWVVGLAGEGLRELTAPAGVVRRACLLLFAIPATLSAGLLRGVLLGAVMAASVNRGQGTWVGLAAGWGWLAGLLFAARAVLPSPWAVWFFLAAGVGVTLWVHIMGGRPLRQPEL